MESKVSKISYSNNELVMATSNDPYSFIVGIHGFLSKMKQILDILECMYCGLDIRSNRLNILQVD